MRQMQNASDTWPVGGVIALAAPRETALLIFGADIWPAIAAGAFIANATHPDPDRSGCGHRVRQHCLGSRGLPAAEIGRLPQVAERVWDVIALVGLAATVSTSERDDRCHLLPDSLHHRWRHLRAALGIWWIGDMMCDLLVAPVLLV
jgi:hypothetical protein